MNYQYYFTIPRLYPIWALAVSCILGICWQSLEYPLYYTFLLALVSFIFLMIVRNTCIALKTIYIVLYAVVFLASGMSYYLSVAQQKEFCQYSHNHTFDVTGMAIDISQTGNFRLPWAIKLKVHSLVCTDYMIEPWNSHISICLYTKNAPSFSVSDTIEVKNISFKTPKNKEFMRYLIKEEVVTTATMDKTSIKLINHPTWSIKRWLSNYRQQLLDHFQQSMNQQTYLSFGSIFLGNTVTKKKVEKMKNHLKVWGLFHYIARAGLHLVIFVSIWMFILSFLPISWFWRQWLMILLSGTYFLLTWPSIPFNRAFFTFLLTKIFTLFGYRSYYVPTLSIVVLITLLIHPMYLFCLDFQLSFGITYALAWFNEIRSQKHS